MHLRKQNGTWIHCSFRKKLPLRTKERERGLDRKMRVEVRERELDDVQRQCSWGKGYNTTQMAQSSEAGPPFSSISFAWDWVVELWSCSFIWGSLEWSLTSVSCGVARRYKESNMNGWKSWNALIFQKGWRKMLGRGALEQSRVCVGRTSFLHPALTAQPVLPGSLSYMI